MFYEKSLSKRQKISKWGEMENFVVSAQIWDLNQVLIKSPTFFPHKIFGVASDSKNETSSLQSRFLEKSRIFNSSLTNLWNNARKGK